MTSTWSYFFLVVVCGRRGARRPWPSRPDNRGVDFSPGAKRRGSLDPASLRWLYAATRTLICFGLASSRSGNRTVSTPALYSALTFAGSTVGGSANVRENEP